MAKFKSLSPTDQYIHRARQRRSLVKGCGGIDPGPDPLVEEIMRLRAEVGRLRAMVRVNAMRHGATEAEINAALDGEGHA